MIRSRSFAIGANVKNGVDTMSGRDSRAMSATGRLVFSVAPVEAVLRLAATYPVFPCRRSPEEVVIGGKACILKAKSPYVRGGFGAASQDQAQIRAWWGRWPDALVGVPTGRKTGLVVVDYDVDKVDAAAQEWVSDHVNELACTRYHGTLSGGWHYIFRAPADGEYRGGSSLALAGAVRKGIDVRAEGGYIIWWPLHGGSTTGEIMPLPAGLLDERRIEARDLQPLPSKTPESWARERKLVADALAYLDPSSYDEWSRAGMAIHLASAGCDDGFNLWHDWSSGEITGECPTNYSGINDCRYHWASYRHDKARGGLVTLGSVFEIAKSRGYATTTSARESPPLDVYALEAQLERAAIQSEAQSSAPDDSDPLAPIRAAIIADLEAGPGAIDAAVGPDWISYPRLPVAGSVLAAPGSTGKTTLVLAEMVHIAAGLELYGSPVDRPGHCVYVSAEDGAGYPRYLLQRILADGRDCGALRDAHVTAAKSAVRIIGWSRTKYGPIMAADQAGNTYVRPVWPLLLELLAPLSPSYVTIDPSVLFGPGERLGNDAAAAFAALLHETAQAISALVQMVDHVSQMVARTGTIDQYASRGGTGKVDESRLARQLVRVPPDTDQPMPPGLVSQDLTDGRVLQLVWTKPSYAPRPPVAWLRRRGHWFEHLRMPNAEEVTARRAQTAESAVLQAEEAVLAYVKARSEVGERLGAREIERSTIIDPGTGERLSVRKSAEAIRRLLASGKLVRREFTGSEKTGFKKDYIDVVF